MAAVRSQEASSFTSRCTFDVFLSFRGGDTRKTFTDHLYTALVGAGFRTFRDDNEIERGENINSELEKAIQQSKSSIIVFSKNYASSRWCLDELMMILERRRTKGHAVLPVFYHVDPSQVRKQMGSYAKAFARHEKRFKEEADDRKKDLMEKVEGWRSALKEAADLGGMVLQNESDGYESKFIHKIVKVIEDKVNRTILSVAPYLIGIDSRVKNINLWLQNGSIDAGIVAICGMSGIGKTTIAKYVFSLNYERFQGSSFLANIREVSGKPNGLVRLQRQLLADIGKGKKKKICSVDEGIIKIKDTICCKRVLIVLDDVDRVDQLDAVLGMRDWFYPGSKIIITTRQKHLLKAHEVYKVHEVEKLDDEESLELFSWHAFGQDHPIEEYMDISKRVIYFCSGLPLALQVLGSSLSGKRIDVWENALEKLKVIPESQILEKLKISYDSLQDDHDKNLFLDIACFCVGKDRDCIITILDGCDFFAKVGIQNLIDRCLLALDKNNKLMMHLLLQDMGREIIRKESLKDPGKRSRLWHHKDVLNVLREKTGTETIVGLVLNLHVLKENKPVETCFNPNNSKRRHWEYFLDKSTLPYEGHSSKRHRLGFFSWLPVNSRLENSFSMSDEIDLQTAAFSRMQRLRVLQLNNVCLTGGYKEFPNNLRWLCWLGFPLRTIPSDFPLESLVALDMRYSRLEQVWKGTKLLRLLRILNLSHSHGLTNTLDFSVLPNLERLILKHCINLIEVHESIGELERLVLLNFEGCKNLRKLPKNIGQLKYLEKLILSNCSKLEELPSELGEMKSLRVLHADRTAINQLLSSTTGKLKLWRSRLRSWVLKPRKNPESISFSLASLTSLINLSLANCHLSDDALPRDFGSLSLLQELNLSGNPICSIPESIKGLTMLRSLGLSSCQRLQSLPELPMSLNDLDVKECQSLRVVTNLPNLLRSLLLDVYPCDQLVEVQELFKLEPIGNIDAEVINSLGLVELGSMGSLEVKLLNNLTFSSKKGPLQGLYEFGIFSVFLPGSEVPGWFNNRSAESTISFNVPSHPNLKIRKLNVCVVYGFTKHRIRTHPNRVEFIKVTNKTKGVKWTYSPTFRGIPDDNKDIIWLSHWNIAELLEGGDQVDVAVGMWHSAQVKELGIHIVYEQEEKGTENNTYPSHQKVIDGGDLSTYQVRTGSYFLCHHEYISHQDYAQHITSVWDDILFGDSVEPRGEVEEEEEEE